MAEKEEGNVEYKLFLKPKNEDRIKELISQMGYRLNEGNGECVYILGITDLGEAIGLKNEEYESSSEDETTDEESNNIKKMSI